ncbi:hypothetical protein M413DRAFT_447877, partial [Hebeloma cylindrosporum]
MFNKLTILAVAAFLPLLVLAQQDPIYVPFEWDRVPATASVIGSSGGTTTYALIDSPGTGRVTPGPATLIQGPSAASMLYVNSAAATTLSGVCNLVSPVALCTLNVQETGAPLPGTGSGGAVVTSTKKSSSTGKSTDSGATSHIAGPTGTIITMSSIALGFCIALALL